MDNAPCHSENFVVSYSNIKIVVSYSNICVKTATSRCRYNKKFKYRKRLLKFVISQIDDTRKAFEIIEEVDVLKAISWIKAAWEEVSDQTVTNCFVSVVFVTRLKMELCKH